MKKCYCCGADVPDNAKFCPKCGKTMEITRNLIDRARANDPDAQTELYERTYKTVYTRIRAKVPDEDTAMDIMQESYLRAFTSLDQLQKAETFPSWLLTIATRKVCDWYRKNGKENENVQMSGLEYENDDTISDEDDILEKPEYRENFSPDESLDRAETGRLLSEILDTLPEDQRIILTMRYYDEMSLQEISDELGVNLSTVKTRLTAGKKKVEAKVLELEKSGTKLYSLGPVAFLVFLLHHAELFAPVISANAIIGLTAAGAGAAAGGAAVGTAAQAAASVTGKAAAGAAVKAAGGAAVKGLSVKVVAAVAAAVVVVGGGATTAAIITNNDTQSESVPESESEAAAVVTPEIDPNQPSEEIIHEMVDPLAYWSVNDMFDDAIAAGPMTLTTNQAAELAAVAYLFGDCDLENEFDSYSGLPDVPESALAEKLMDLFGPGYQLSDFTNTTDVTSWGETEYLSAFPDIGASQYTRYRPMALYKNDDQFRYNFYLEFGHNTTEGTVITKIEKTGSGGDNYLVNVEYDYCNSHVVGFDNAGGEIEEDIHQGRDVEYELTSCEESAYGWIISQITYKDFHALDSDRDNGDLVYPVNGLSQKRHNMLGAMEMYSFSIGNNNTSYGWHNTNGVLSGIYTFIRYHSPLDEQVSWPDGQVSWTDEGSGLYLTGVPEELIKEAAYASYPDFDGDLSQIEAACSGDDAVVLHYQDGVFWIYTPDGGRGDLEVYISFWEEHADGTCTVDMEYGSGGPLSVSSVYRFELKPNIYPGVSSDPYFIYSITGGEELANKYGNVT